MIDITYADEIAYIKTIRDCKSYYLENSGFLKNLDEPLKQEVTENVEKELKKLNSVLNALESLEIIRKELFIKEKTTNLDGELLYKYELNVVGKNDIDILEKGLKI